MKPKFLGFFYLSIFTDKKKGDHFMAIQNNQSAKNDADFHSGVVILLVLVGIVLYQSVLPKVLLFIEEHWFLASMLTGFACYGIWKLIQWRYRVNNPEKYKRSQTLKIISKLWEVPNSIWVGSTLKDQKKIFLTPEMRTGHVQILGATGRGKTKSVIVPWFVRDLKNCAPPILIDGKGDSALYDEIKRAASSENARIPCFDPLRVESSCTINPLEGGSPHEVADRLFASLEFESAYFRELQYAAVLMILEIFELLRTTPTLKGIYEALSEPQNLLDRVSYVSTRDKYSKFPDHLTRELMKLCQMREEDRFEKFSGILSQLRPFASGVFSKLVNTEYLDETNISLDAAVNPRRALDMAISGLVILLPTMQFQKTAKVLGKLILQSLAWSTARRDSSQSVTSVFIDEFSAFVYDGFEQYLNKARSKGVALHLSHQSMGDLENISPSFAKTINVNTNIKVLLGLNDPDTADYFARHLGTFTTTKETERASKSLWGSTNKSGEMSLRSVEEYRIHPNRLKAFSHGQGVLSLNIYGQPLVEEVQFDARA